MSNYLKMDEKQTLEALLKLGWPYRRIERETGIRRETISKYHRQLLDSKPARVATGSGQSLRSLPRADRRETWAGTDRQAHLSGFGF